MIPCVHYSFLILKLSHNPNEGQVHKNKTRREFISEDFVIYCGVLYVRLRNGLFI